MRTFSHHALCPALQSRHLKLENARLKEKAKAAEAAAAAKDVECKELQRQVLRPGLPCFPKGAAVAWH